jgi:Globin
LPLTDKQKEMVGTTWARVLPISDEAARLFYGRLFEIDPSTEPLFAGANMDEQGKKPKQTIDVAVAGLDDLDLIRLAV